MEVSTYVAVLGIDEVGRGPWAGPLVVGAVVLGGITIDGLADSKKLTKKKREALDKEIRDNVAGVGLGWVKASEIDEIGLSAALRLATRRAVEQVTAPYHEIIIDGTINFLSDTTKGSFVKTMPKADALIPSVSAASIVAKVARDNYMAAQDEIYPGYGFASHVGYGTARHREAIEARGVTPLHRLSFAPLAKYRPIDSKERVSQDVQGASRTTRMIGNDSEAAAAQELLRRGHRIVARNWKTKYCEIDIVSCKNDIYYFSEVKHRRTTVQGNGFDAITSQKLRQMHYAARFYAHVKNLCDTDMRLLAIATTGNNYSVVDVSVVE